MTLIIVSLVLLILALGAGMAYWYSFWKPHALKFSRSGYVPPPTSIFGRFTFAFFCYLLTFLTVGRVKVIGRKRLPRGGHLIFAANHQLPVDFAMVRRGSFRHFRMLTSSDELKGFFGVISAFVGVISVSTRVKGDGALAESACVDVVSSPGGALGIFPQGALLPDNNLRKEEFRPGVVRMIKAAQERLGYSDRALTSMLGGASVARIVPMAIYYRHDPVHADWTHRVFGSLRSKFLGMRNPRHWDPIFKQSLEGLPAGEAAEIERLREEKLAAYKRSRVTNYGGVVVIGDPIEAASLPEDPLAAVEVIRVKIADLLEQARQH